MKIKKSLAAILTLCMIVPLASCNNQDSSSEKNDAPSAAVSSDNRSKYYCSPFVFKIVDDNTFEPVKIYDEKVMSDTKIPDTMKEYYEKTGEKYDPKVSLKTMYSNPYYMVYSGGEFYGRDRDNYASLKHWSFMDTDMVKEEVLYSTENLKSVSQKIFDSTDYDEKYIESHTKDRIESIIESALRDEYDNKYEDDENPILSVKEFIESNYDSYKSEHYDELYNQALNEEKDNYYENAAGTLIVFLKDPIDGGDGYIYSVLRADNEHISAYFPLDAKLVRFAKDGSKYEVIDGVSASAMTISDGYIYYYNSGSHEDDDLYTSDAKVRGIYKMKPDGSDKKKIADITNTSYPKEYTTIVTRMTVYNGNIYFMKYDDNFDLYRVSTDGGTPEKYSDIHCCNYTIDQSSNMLYYVGVAESIAASSREVISKDLSGGSEKKIEYSDSSIKGVHCSNYAAYLLIDGDYLYINNPNQFGSGIVEMNRADTVNGITDSEYNRYTQQPSGERLNIKTGTLEYLFSYRNVKLEENMFGTTITYMEPLKTEWKSTEEVHQILESMLIKIQHSS